MVATKVELFELIRQPGLILAVPAPASFAWPERGEDGMTGCGPPAAERVFVRLVRGHGTISPWAARIRAGAFFVPSLPVRRRRAWPSPMIAWWPSWTWGP